MKSWHVISGAAVVGALIVAGWIFWALNAPAIAAWWLDGGDPNKAGPWGDSFGPFNALFAALGFSAVLATLLIQARALQAQQDDQHRQRFESSFFELLGLLRNVRAELRFSYSEDYLKAHAAAKPDASIKTGKEAFLFAYREMRHWVTSHPQHPELDKAELAAIYHRHVHDRYESDFGPYFRLIYTILDRIREDKILSATEKATYSNLLRGQLESIEIFLLGVNGLSPISKDLPCLIEQFRMLKYLPRDSARRQALWRHYSQEAFAARDGTKPAAPSKVADPSSANGAETGAERPGTPLPQAAKGDATE